MTELEDRFTQYASDWGMKLVHRDKLLEILRPLKEYHLPSYEHSLRVGMIAADIAKEVHLEPKVALFGVVHDVGKKDIPLEVLAKVAGFNDFDAEVMNFHPIAGYFTAKQQGLLFTSWLALTHHRYQKRPYPLNLPERPLKVSNGTNLLMDEYSRIVALADFYDALRRKNDKFKEKNLSPEEMRMLMENYNIDRLNLVKHLYDSRVLR